MQSTLTTVLETLLVGGLCILVYLWKRERGRRWGPYRDVRLLSEHGGMSKIYQAYNSEEQRECILKVLREEHLGDNDIVRKFRREGEILKHLKEASPTVPTPVFYGDGTVSLPRANVPYIEMEYIPGHTNLGDLLRQKGQLSLQDAEVVVAQVCRALQLAHNLGVVHRDIKPWNILLAGGKSEAVVVIDFGAAKLVSSQSVTVGELGTVYYMPPEREAGRPADIYSLGAVWYELVTGTKLYSDSNPVIVMQKHQTEDAAPLVRRNVPAPLRPLLTSMLNRDPGRRPTVEAVMAHLQEEARRVEGYRPRNRTRSAISRPDRVRMPRQVLIGLGLVPFVLLAWAIRHWQGPKPPTPPPPTPCSWPQLLSGYLVLRTSPPGAEVYFTDGPTSIQPRGCLLAPTTPVDGLRLPVGQYELVVRIANHETRTIQVTIGADSTSKVDLTLPSGHGSVRIVGDLPAGVQALIDNRPVKPGERVSRSVGNHECTFQSEIYRDATVPVKIDSVGQEMVIPAPGNWPFRTGTVRILSSPVGAELGWDDSTKGVLPEGGLVMRNRVLGNHNAKVSLDGYEDSLRLVQVAEGTNPDVRVVLLPLRGRLTVDPSSGCEVSVAANGSNAWNDLGRAPATFALPAGDYRVRLAIPGYDSWETTVTVARGGEARLVHRFPRPGTLNVAPGHILGEVYIDGELRGWAGLTIQNLKPGNHVVEIRREGFQADRRTVLIPDGGLISVIPNLHH